MTTGYNGPGGVGHEFVPPPPDDRDAWKGIIVIVAILLIFITGAIVG